MVDTISEGAMPVAPQLCVPLGREAGTTRLSRLLQRAPAVLGTVDKNTAAGLPISRLTVQFWLGHYTFLQPEDIEFVFFLTLENSSKALGNRLDSLFTSS